MLIKPNLCQMSFFISLLVMIFIFSGSSNAQKFEFKPGFNQQEADDLLNLNYAFLDTSLNNKFHGYLQGYALNHRTASVGLDNRADVWLREDSVVVILIRGTTGTKQSILEDLYCAMIPANGQVKLGSNKTFDYKLAKDERAAVHAGFFIGFAYLAYELEPRIHELFKNGYHKFIIAGHSQGGAICYYFSSWLMQMKKDKKFSDVLVKTYASASPKVGNMYFSYDYDNANLSNWSYSIINTSDAVPEMPFSTQQVEIDMNEPNPILLLMKKFDDLPFFKRIILKNIFRNMKNRAQKSSEAYQKYLGRDVGKFIKKLLPELELPAEVATTYFTRPGVPIILSTNQNYWDYFSDAPKFFHHSLDAYRFLLREYYIGLSPFEPREKHK